MAISYVQSAIAKTTGATSVTATWNSSTATGNYIVAVVMVYTNSLTVAVTDTQSNTYSASRNFLGSNVNLYVCDSANITGGSYPSASVTATASGSTAMEICVREYSGMPTSVATGTGFDKYATADSTTGTSISPTSPYIYLKKRPATLNTQQLMIAAAGSLAQPQTWSVGGGFGNLDTINNSTNAHSFAVCDQIVTVTNTPASYRATFGVGTSAFWRSELLSWWDFPPSITPKTVTADQTTAWNY